LKYSLSKLNHAAITDKYKVGIEKIGLIKDRENILIKSSDGNSIHLSKIGNIVSPRFWNFGHSSSVKHGNHPGNRVDLDKAIKTWEDQAGYQQYDTYMTTNL
jgi:hypothetical protein